MKQNKTNKKVKGPLEKVAGETLESHSGESNKDRTATISPQQRQPSPKTAMARVSHSLWGYWGPWHWRYPAGRRTWRCRSRRRTTGPSRGQAPLRSGTAPWDLWAENRECGRQAIITSYKICKWVTGAWSNNTALWYPWAENIENDRQAI